MLVKLSNKYFRLKTRNYAVYLPVYEYNQIFPDPFFKNTKKLNSSYLLHILSKEDQKEMENEVRCLSNDGILPEHIFEYMEFDNDILKLTKRLEHDNPVNGDTLKDGEEIKLSCINYQTTLSHRNNSWVRHIKINKIKTKITI